MPTRYVCPKCGKKVIIHVSFNGWEDELIDPETGEASDLVASGRDSINAIEYDCSNPLCKWEGDEDWFDEVTDAIEEEKERAQSKANQIPT